MICCMIVWVFPTLPMQLHLLRGDALPFVGDRLSFTLYCSRLGTLSCTGGLRDALRKKRDYMGKIPNQGGRGVLEQSHYLMSIYQVIFWHAKIILRC